MQYARCNLYQAQRERGTRYNVCQASEFLSLDAFVTVNNHKWVHTFRLEPKKGTGRNRVKPHPTSHHAIGWPKAHAGRIWGITTHRYTCQRLGIYFDVSRFSLKGSGWGGMRSGWEQGVIPEQGVLEARVLANVFIFQVSLSLYMSSAPLMSSTLHEST